MTRSDRPRTIEEAKAEVERELQVRSRCYDNWIRDGKMTSIDAVDRMDRLAAAFDLLTALETKLGKAYIHAKDQSIPF